jgi:hypothetical protein
MELRQRQQPSLVYTTSLSPQPRHLRSLRVTILSFLSFYVAERNLHCSLDIASITAAQRHLVLLIYMPYFLVPLLMTVDMASRVGRLARLGIKYEEEAKRR